MIRSLMIWTLAHIGPAHPVGTCCWFAAYFFGWAVTIAVRAVRL
jgi:hypothetical protein